MPDMIITLQLRERPDGGFEATSEDAPDLFAKGSTAGEALENAKKMIVGDSVEKTEAVATPCDLSKLQAKGGGEASDDSMLRQYMILDKVEQEDRISQRQLAQFMNLNLSTVNQILKRLIKKGYIKTNRINGRRLAYYLTPRGFSEKMRLVLSYTKSTIRFFTTVREVVNAELGRLKAKKGIRSVSIMGTGELAEAVYLSAREMELEVGAVYDQEQVGTTWLGHKVLWPFHADAQLADVLIQADIVHSDSLETIDTKHMAFVNLAQLLSEGMGRFAKRMDTEDAPSQTIPARLCPVIPQGHR